MSGLEKIEALYYAPGIEEHILVHHKDWIMPPMIETAHSIEYLKQIEEYLKEHPDDGGSNQQYAFGMLETVRRNGGVPDNDTLEALHVAEASTRNITQWTLQEILMMQESLDKHGYPSDGDLFAQRKEILNILGNVVCESPDLETYENIGKKVCGLELCMSDVWPLRQVSVELAQQLQDQVTENFGARYYNNRVLLSMHMHPEPGTNRENIANMITADQEESRRVFMEARTFVYEYIKNLPPEIQKELYRFESGAAKVVLKTEAKNIKGQIAAIFEKILSI